MAGLQQPHHELHWSLPARHSANLATVGTVAILAQGTSWAVAVTQAFLRVGSILSPHIPSRGKLNQAKQNQAKQSQTECLSKRCAKIRPESSNEKNVTFLLEKFEISELRVQTENM